MVSWGQQANVIRTQKVYDDQEVNDEISITRNGLRTISISDAFTIIVRMESMSSHGPPHNQSTIQDLSKSLQPRCDKNQDVTFDNI